MKTQSELLLEIDQLKKQHQSEQAFTAAFEQLSLSNTLDAAYLEIPKIVNLLLPGTKVFTTKWNEETDLVEIASSSGLGEKFPDIITSFGLDPKKILKRVNEMTPEEKSFYEHDFLAEIEIRAEVVYSMGFLPHEIKLGGIFLLCKNKLEISLREQVEKMIKKASYTLQRKMYEKRVQDSEKKYRTLFDTMAQGVVYQNQDGKITSANPAAENILGLTLDQLTGKTSMDPRWKAMKMDGSDFPGIEHPIPVSLRTGKEVKNLIHSVYRPETNDTVWLSVSSVPLFHPGESKPYQAYATFENITELKKTQDDLRNVKQTLQLAMDCSEAGIAIADAPDGKLRYVNDAGLLIQGGDRESIVNDIGIDKYVASWQLYNLDGTALKSDEVPLARAVMYGEHCSKEFVIRRKSGEDRFVIANAAPIKDCDNKIIAGIVVFFDITEKKKAEEELKFAYLKLDAFWNIATLQYETVKTIGDHILASIVKMTESKMGFFGYVDNSETTMTIHSWSGEAMHGCSMVDKPSVFQISAAGIWSEAIKTRKPFILNDYSEEHPAKKGIPIGHVMLSNLLVVPIFSKGKIVSIAAVANRIKPYTSSDAMHLTAFVEASQAIVERNNAESELRSSKSKLEQALSAANAGTWDWDIVNNQFHWSKEFFQIFGIHTNVTPSFEAWSAALHPQDREIAAKRITHAIEAKKELVSDYRIILSDGSQKWIRSIGNCSYENEKPIRMSGLCIDITDRKREEQNKAAIEARLNQSQKLDSLGILAGGIAHDFNNLLGGIFGFIELANDTNDMNEKTDFLNRATDSIERARGLTGQLLTFAKGGGPIKKIEPLFPFVKETALFALAGSSVSIEFDICENLWHCNFDKNQIGQVIDNLIINAKQSMPQGGVIFLIAKNIELKEKQHPSLKEGNYVQLSIKDYGIGIPPVLLSKIFDPFFTTKTKGHGLGLSTSYSIISKHGGTIDVESEPNQGSIFHIYLPATSDKGMNGLVSKSSSHKGHGTFLVMDDEDIVRDSVSRMLGGFGYSVTSKSNGTEALSFFLSEFNEKREVSAMIFDLTIPGGMGGKETANEIRKISSNVPIFVMSGYADDPVMSNPEQYGFTASISKPFSKSELEKLLNKHIRSFQSL